MRAVGTNVLIYAFFADSPFHVAAKTVIDELAQARAAWAIPWACIHEFYAVASNPKIFPLPDQPQRALAQIDAWFHSPSLQLLAENSAHWGILSGLLSDSGAAGPMVHDAKIAAICLSHGVSELVTLDRDFSRFPALKVHSILD
jgi:toxin-antitoxin system PIN domain toxin